MQLTKKQSDMEKMIQHLHRQSDGCSTKALSDHISCNIKTIQNYINEINEGYIQGVELVKLKRGYYKVIDNRTNINEASIEAEKKVYLKLAVETMEGLSDISKHHDEVVDDLKLNKVSTAYYIKPEAYEKLNTDEEEILLLEEAILKDTIIIFSYKSKEFHVEPYRLVNFDGIWYLYGKDKEEHRDNPYKTWLLEFIDNVEVEYSQKHNTPDDLIEEHLEEADSAGFVVGNEFEVKLKVSHQIADIFRRRNHLPDQHSTIQEDGSLLVSSTVSTYSDIDPEIKSWIPYVVIIEPLEYKEKFKLELQEYVNRLA